VNEEPISGRQSIDRGRDDRSVGEILAQAREALGLTLDDLANQLKFSPRQIEALESGRYEQLPGGPFVRGMVRSYARLVDVDPDVLLERMAGAPMAADASRIAARFKQPVPFSDASRRSTMTYATLAVLALVVAVVVFFQWRQEQAGVVKPPAAAPVARAPTPAVPPAGGGLPPAGEAATAVNPQSVAEPVPTSPAVIPVETFGRQRVGLRVEEESWVEIKDAYGTTLLSHLIPAGRERTIVGEAPLSIVIGNAHHVQLTHNGNPVDLKPHIKVEVARLTLK